MDNTVDIMQEPQIGPVLTTEWPDEETEKDRKQQITAQRIANIKPHQFTPGISPNPGGRPKGMSMKQWMRQYLASLTDSERIAFFQGMDKIDLWRMAEGNPSEDKNISITVPTPILGGIATHEALTDTSMVAEKPTDTPPSEGSGSTKDIPIIGTDSEGHTPPPHAPIADD